MNRKLPSALTVFASVLAFLAIFSLWANRQLLDTDNWTAVYRRAEYDIAGAMAAIRAANLPDSLAERLQHGQ